MVSGDDDPDDAPVLAPEELDISEDDHVAEIDDGRYVVSPHDPIDDVKTTESTANTSSTAPESGPGDVENDTSNSQRHGPKSATASNSQTNHGTSPPSELTDQQVNEWLRETLEASDSSYGFHVTAKFEGSVKQRRMMSNDVVTIFESLILWYAQNIDTNTPVEEVLGILLMEANVPIRYPPKSLQQVIQSAGLSPDDSIADLMQAITDDDGMKL